MLAEGDAPDVEVVELAAAEEREYVEAECRRLLDMDFNAFTLRWQAGEFINDADPRVTQVAMLLP